MSVFIIAEAGINFSSFEEARSLAREAKDAGANIVKYQTHFNWEYPMLSKEQWVDLFDYCHLIGIEFMSTAWSFEAIDFLADIGMTHWKIPSSEIGNMEYCKHIKSKNPKYVYASHGFLDGEYHETYKLFNPIDNPTIQYQLLTCISKYPLDLSEVDLRESTSYFGWSDHTDNIYLPIILASRGLFVLEKHFCLSHPCIDDAVSITPDKFKEMVDVIRRLENYKEPVIPPEILALKNRVRL